MSSLDKFLHDIYTVKFVAVCLSSDARSKLHVPAEIIHLSTEDQTNALENFVRNSIGHLSFIDPGRMAETFTPICPGFWEQISKEASESPKALKAKLRTIYRWRNRIAHEADINPTFAGADLWPIASDDVLDAISFVEELANAIFVVVKSN